MKHDMYFDDKISDLLVEKCFKCIDEEDIPKITSKLKGDPLHTLHELVLLSVALFT